MKDHVPLKMVDCLGFQRATWQLSENRCCWKMHWTHRNGDLLPTRADYWESRKAVGFVKQWINVQSVALDDNDIESWKRILDGLQEDKCVCFRSRNIVTSKTLINSLLTIDDGWEEGYELKEIVFRRWRRDAVRCVARYDQCRKYDKASYERSRTIDDGWLLGLSEGYMTIELKRDNE